MRIFEDLKNPPVIRTYARDPISVSNVNKLGHVLIHDVIFERVTFIVDGDVKGGWLYSWWHTTPQPVFNEDGDVVGFKDQTRNFCYGYRCLLCRVVIIASDTEDLRHECPGLII